jgi:CHAT domain-containing protein
MDPVALQKRAVERIDAFVDNFRRTGDFRSRIGDLAQADLELAESNRLLSLRGDSPALALGLIKRGHVYRMQGRWDEAIPFYDSAAQVAARMRDAVRQADAIAWRALTHNSGGARGSALTDATEAARLAETTPDKDVLAMALDILAAVQIAQGDLSGAADTVNREIAAASQGTDRSAPYYAYLNRSDVYLKVAEKCDVQREFAPCYEAVERARVDLQQARTIASQLGYTALVGQTDQFLKELDMRRELIKTQEASHRQTQNMGKIFHPRAANDVLVTQHFVSQWSPGEIPPALVAQYQQSVQQQQKLGPLGVVAAGRTQFLEGNFNEMQGKNDAALASYLNAVASLEGDRRSLSDERSRGALADDRAEFYYRAIEQLLERRKYPEAFQLLELSRSRALADLLATRRLGLGKPAEQQLYADSTLLRTQIGDAQSRMFEVASGAESAQQKATLADLQKQIRELETRYQTVLSRIAVEAPRVQTLVTSGTAPLDVLQRSMRSERYEMLQYLVLEHAVLVWHITADSVDVFNVFLPRSELMAKVASLSKSFERENAPFDETSARELYLYLIQPVVKEIRGDRLVIVPHDDLHHVPFEVLQDPADGHYVGERFDITYAPSASILLNLKRSAALAGGRLLAVVNPTLAGAPAEARTIARLFGAQSKVSDETLALERDVKTWVRDFDVIHFAVHGKFADDPMLSFLELREGGGDDGRLTAAEMFGLPLENSRLVVLAACETGRVEATHGNEILGIERALLYAGAGTLVLSRWKVDTVATSLWMESFYRAALTRLPAAAAREALKAVKSDARFRNPYYWGAFAMVGR